MKGLTLYRLLLRLLAPLLWSHLLWLSVRDNNRRYLRERTGRYEKKHLDRPVWFHAASVGEVNAVMPLLELLHRRRPQLPLLLTTSTVSSARTARNRLPSGVEHAFLPIDWPGSVRRFLRTFEPRCALVVETEIWPNLFAEVGAHGIPLLIINGRLSRRTIGAPRWVRELLRSALGHVSAVLARSPEDSEAYVALGAPEARVETVGNLKFAALGAHKKSAAAEFGRPYVVAASTRDGEERLVVEAWTRAETRGELLVLVPRHPQRLNEILRDLKGFNLRLAVRSRGDRPDPETAVYIADTFGELGGFLAGAELVFVGGSLVPKGGQNLLEPAELAKAVVFGPFMENFAAEATLLLEEGAAVQVGSPQGLAEVFTRLLSDGEARRQLGERARSAVERRSDMAERYLEALERHCGRGLV